jgi:protein-tyrosine phosphatase
MKINGNDIKLRSVLNFRDIAGKDTFLKKGLIYRSANPDNISKEDMAKLARLGITTIIDLRGPSEIRKRKSLDGINIINLPLDFQGKTRERLYPHFKIKNSEDKILEVSNTLYLEIAEASAPVLAEIIRIVGNTDSGAILIHCQAGKDRTGILVALIHLIAGTERRMIVEDFLRSNEELIPYFRKMFMLRKIITFGFFPYSTVIFAIEVRERNIVSVIDMVMGRPGGIEGYLGKTGIDTSLLEKFRNKLLDNGKN